jgi:hypothetical protein
VTDASGVPALVSVVSSGVPAAPMPIPMNSVTTIPRIYGHRLGFFGVGAGDPGGAGMLIGVSLPESVGSVAKTRTTVKAMVAATRYGMEELAGSGRGSPAPSIRADRLVDSLRSVA